MKLEEKYQPIWDVVRPLMATVLKKDYVIHVEMVTRAMYEILENENGDKDILIPCALLHDIGWSVISSDLQMATDKESKDKAGHLHIENAPKLIRDILSKLNYNEDKITRIIDVVQAHKYQTPTEKEKQLLIDADNLSDTYKEAFFSDIKSYNTNPKDALDFRSKNKFYTKIATNIFNRELQQRYLDVEKEDY